MQTSAKLRFAHLSAQKGRLVADQIRGLPVEKALDVLAFEARWSPRTLVAAAGRRGPCSAAGYAGHSRRWFKVELC